MAARSPGAAGVLLVDALTVIIGVAGALLRRCWGRAGADVTADPGPQRRPVRPEITGRFIKIPSAVRVRQIRAVDLVCPDT